jgi:hypothetical protein
MTIHETKTWTCDNPGCDKSQERHPKRGWSSYIQSPHEPWLQINVDGNYQGVFHDSVKCHYDACSPECAIKILERAIERLKSAPKLDPMRVL